MAGANLTRQGNRPRDKVAALLPRLSAQLEHAQKRSLGAFSQRLRQGDLRGHVLERGVRFLQRIHLHEPAFRTGTTIGRPGDEVFPGRRPAHASPGKTVRKPVAVISTAIASRIIPIIRVMIVRIVSESALPKNDAK